MRKIVTAVITVWISSLILSGCASTKSGVFGEDMPSMKEIHDQKFQKSDETISKPSRPIHTDQPIQDSSTEFHWIPNPTLNMHVFRHLSPAGNPVPGYNTYFKLYDQNHLAIPGEYGGQIND